MIRFKKVKLLKLLPIACLSLSFESHSFELKTHLFVANEVIEDAKDGKVTIQPYGEFSVDSAKVNALTSNKVGYFLGAMGPDISPDFIAAQVTVHPGLHKSSYGVADSGLQKMGMVFTPPPPIPDIIDPREDYQLPVFQELPVANYGASTDEWLKWLADKPNDISDSKWIAYYLGYMSHAASDIFAHTYVNYYSGDAFSLADSDGLAVETRHKLLEMYIAKFQPYQVSADDLSNAYSYADALQKKLIHDPWARGQYKLSGTATYLSKMYDFADEVEHATSNLNILLAWLEANIVINNERRAHYELLIARYDAAFEENSENVERQRQEFQDIIDELTPIAEFAVCEYIYEESEQQNARNLGWCRWAAEVEDAILGINEAQDGLNALGGQIDIVEFYQNNPDLAAAADALGLGQLTRSQAVQALVLVAGAIVFAEELNYESLALNLALANYRNDVVNNTMETYIQANIDTAKNIVQGKSFNNAIEPLESWVLCNAPVFTHEDGYFMPAFCDGYESFNEALVHIRDSLKNVVANTMDDLMVMHFYTMYQNIQYDIQQAIEETGREVAERILDDDMRLLLNLVSGEVNDAKLEQAFELGGNGVGLLKIPDIVARLKTDMRENGTGKFDKNNFPPIYNAITLSKLLLVDDDELNRLERLAGVSETNFLSSYHEGEFSILYSWVGSLDGNHQWMLSSPMLPRAAGYTDQSTTYERNYSVQDGFVWWADDQKQSRIFNQIFKGPLIPSLENAIDSGHLDILQETYLKRSCFKDPFPQTELPEKCMPIVSWLIPVLNILN